MNGKTKINERLNPCTAAIDRATYGFKWLNYTTYGHRLIKISVLSLCFDFYGCGKGRVFMYARCANAGTLFYPLGSVTWPMPRRNPNAA